MKLKDKKGKEKHKQKNIFSYYFWTTDQKLKEIVSFF